MVSELVDGQQGEGDCNITASSRERKERKEAPCMQYYKLKASIGFHDCWHGTVQVGRKG